jgi:hypothetical protein
MADWEVRELAVEQNVGPRVFTCEVLLKANGRVARRWLNVDGVLLVDGRIMLNKTGALHQAALHAGLDPAAVTAQLLAWVGAHAADKAELAAGGAA